MKFKINRGHFSNGLSQVLNVVGSKANMPILGNVLIQAEKDHISLATTNLDLGIRCKVKAEVKEGGIITLPVKLLERIVRELPSNDVSVETSEKHQAKISSGGSVFRIMGMPKDEFPVEPEISEVGSVTLAQEELAAMVNSVSYAQSIDETRHILNGVYFNFRDGKILLAATDGRRLAVTSKELPAPTQASSVILPAKTITELQRILNKGTKVRLSFGERKANFEASVDKDPESGLLGNIQLHSKIVEGNYPNYQQVIPKETHHRIKLDRELFLQCVHRAALVNNDKSNSVKIKLGTNLLEITASSPDFGESHESMAIEYSGPELQVGFNPTFLMDPLKALTKDEVFFELKDENSPGVFKTLESFLCVIMPVRLA